MRSAHKETRSTRFFDRLTRRAALLGGAATVAAVGTRTATAHVATPITTPVPEASPVATAPVRLLFVQYAGPTTLSPGTTDVHTLTMTEVRAQTIYFSDRPNRISGAEPTATFVDSFAQVFADSAPNASLIGHLESGGHQEEAVVLTLLSATYDAAAATLTYEVRLLDGELITDQAFEQEPLSVFDAPREYAEASLFIDDATTDTCVPENDTVPLGPSGEMIATCCEGLVPELRWGSWMGCRVPPTLPPVGESFTCESRGPAPCGDRSTSCCAERCEQNELSGARFVGCQEEYGFPGTYLSEWSCICPYPS